MPDELIDLIVAEIDARKIEARRAVDTRDIAIYREIFSPDLEYIQVNGKKISRDQLMVNVKRQFAHYSGLTSESHRETIIVFGRDSATETVSQVVRAEVVVFFVVKRRWTIKRRGEYTWIRTHLGWQISKVVVLEEFVS